MKIMTNIDIQKYVVHKIVIYLFIIYASCGLLMASTGHASVTASAIPVPEKPATQEVTSGESHFTLDRLIALTEKNNLLFKASTLDTKIAREEYRDERTLENPEMEYSWGKMDIPGEPIKPALWGLGAKWEVPNPIHRYFYLKSMRKQVTEAVIQADMEKREIIKNLKIHFYKLIFSKKQKKLLEEKMQILEEINRITKAKVSIGETKAIDALRSSVEIQKNKTDLFKVEKVIALNRAKIMEILNQSIPADFTVPNELPFSPLAGVEEKLTPLVLQSPTIRLKFNRLELEKNHAKAAGFSVIEGFEVFAEREKEAEGKKWKVGVGVSIPLFDQKTAHRRKAKYLREKAKLQLEHGKQHFLADMRHSVAEIRILEKEIETFKGAVLKEGRENLRLSERLYKEGEVPLMVFLDSQNSFYELQERYDEAVTEWNILKAELEALLGDLL